LTNKCYQLVISNKPPSLQNKRKQIRPGMNMRR